MNRNELTERLFPIEDKFLLGLKNDWFTGSHKIVTVPEFAPKAIEWFKSTKINNIQGWELFPYTDVIMGCTHYIESFIIRHGWDGFQILNQEYGYYAMQGKHGNNVGELEPNKPLIVSTPNWFYGDMRPEWDALLIECEQKNIDIHIDFAWITTAKGIEINLDHPRIQSFAMSMSKYAMQWNRVGIRWCKQRTMDSITMLNHYYKDVNSSLTSVGSFMIDNIPRDYAWNKYGNLYRLMCKELELYPTKMIHAVKVPGVEKPMGCGDLLVKAMEHGS